MTSIIITLLYVFHKIPLVNILGDRGMGYYSTALVIYLLFMTFMVYGMPKAIAETGLVDEVVALDDVAKTITKNVGVK